MTKPKPTAPAYYFPNRHVDPQNGEWQGKGGTEWEVLKYARPRFEGQKQSKVPLHGYEDGAAHRVMAKEIDAVGHGVEGLPSRTPTAF